MGLKLGDLKGAAIEKQEDSMKTLCKATGILALALLAAAQTVRAQEPVLANIPFAFKAGNTALPAGEYRVDKVRDGSDVLVIRCTE